MIKGVLQHLQRHEDALESHQPETDSPVGGFQPAAGADTLPDSDLHKGGTVHSVPGYSQYFSAVDFYFTIDHLRSSFYNLFFSLFTTFRERKE